VDKSWFTAPEYAEYRKPGNIKVPFWLQPEKYYAGAAWYQREIEIPPVWRASGGADAGAAALGNRLWVDGRRSVPTTASPRRMNTTWARHWRQANTGSPSAWIMPDCGVGVNSHCVSDHTQGNWNGIVGKIELRCDPPPWAASDGL